jgi:hypothetical protein
MIRNGQTLNGLSFLGGVLPPCDPELYERRARGCCWRRNEEGDCARGRREEDCDVEEACRLNADPNCWYCCWRSRLQAGTPRELLRISWRQAWRPDAEAAIVGVRVWVVTL